MIRDPFGLQRLHYELNGSMHASTVREIFAERPQLPRTLDRLAVAGHLCGEATPQRSFFQAIGAVPPGHALVRTEQRFMTRPHPTRPKPGNLSSLLQATLERAIEAAPRPIAVALSGGLDSAVVLALAHTIDSSIPAIVLAPRIEGYSELEGAKLTAQKVGADLCVAEVTANDFLHALPAAIAAMEVPLYNLHPVGKLLLGQAARRAGFATLLTGDGVDQVFKRDQSADYLPLVGAAFQAAGVELVAPFLDNEVIGHLLSLPIDAEKTELRAMAANLPIPNALSASKKVTRLFPPIDLEPLVSRDKLVRLAEKLESDVPTFLDDRSRVRFSTLALLLDAFEAWQ
jgi:asparagine synthase (glutamine-hydrolysing)